MGARQPVLARLEVAADAGIEQLARRAVVTRPGDEEEIMPFIILQGQTHTSFGTFRAEIGDGPYHASGPPCSGLRSNRNSPVTKLTLGTRCM